MKALVWFVWFLIMIVGNVVFMNFIVAVVSESYEKCMQTQKVEQYRLKCQMIVERESIMSHEDFENKIYFPKYLVVRQSSDQEELDN